jgi:hypothetical protein
MFNIYQTAIIFNREIEISTIDDGYCSEIRLRTWRFDGSYYTDLKHSFWHDLIACFCGGKRDYSYEENGCGYIFLREPDLDHFQFLTRQ